LLWFAVALNVFLVLVYCVGMLAVFEAGFLEDLTPELETIRRTGMWASGGLSAVVGAVVVRWVGPRLFLK
jgi:hypothetical protein